MDTDYILRCVDCKNTYQDQYTLTCQNGCNSLIRAEYPKFKQFKPNGGNGLFKFSNWLPIRNTVSTESKPVTYRAENLGKELGLENLFVTFNGYWPEKNAFITSGSFKELEAYPTFLRLSETKQGIIQVSSAGNTARAFTHVSSKLNKPLVIAVPETSLHRIWNIKESENVCLVAIKGDYYDAIDFGKQLTSADDNIYPEGGAKNVARRDGMGLTMIEATFAIGKIPDYYFQGVGSGTGGIAAYESVLKLQMDGRYGSHTPKFYLSQNEPFVPMANAWNAKRREIIPEIDMPNAKEKVEKVYADLLTNRKPPYSVKGGVYDTLVATNGEMPTVSNQKARMAEKLFLDIEGIDIDPAAAVAFASLIDIAENEESFNTNGNIMLNITGGGYKRIEEDFNKIHLEPLTIISPESNFEETFSEISDWYSN